MSLRKITCFFLLLLPLTQVMAANLQSISVKEEAEKASLSFTLDSAVAHKVFTLTNPNRVVVDFDNAVLAFDIKKLPIDNSLIKLVRSGHPNPQTLRLVFEVKNDIKLSSKSLKSAPTSGHAFALDISASATPSPDKKKQHQGAKPIQASKNPKLSGLRNVVVVLDPGHGGKDPGAMGQSRHAEKNITLAIATKLKTLINRQPGMRAVLTRDGDYYVGLRERLNIARKHNADFFISIHADAFINKGSSGASVFALSQRGATSEAARWLAEKENYSELGGVNLRNLDDQSGLVRTVLIDLSQTATIAASLQMGQNVLSQLNHLTNLHNHRVEQARFMVLKSPDIPSVLIETGFISNLREEANLKNAAYQTRLCQSIFQGLKHYFKENPPHGTRIEAGTA